MYAVESLLEANGAGVQIDVYERLPSPWGLVRGGVAPDHPEKKLVIDRLFQFYFQRPEVRYFGNVEVGKDIEHEELADHYHAVIYAVGADGDARLGIPGESLPGSWSAREFVAWYNGHPEYSHLQFDLSTERAVIVGNGNVALDVARILTAPVAQLRATDIAGHALDALAASRITEVLILGRRADFQGAFNNPELEELGFLDGVAIEVVRGGTGGASRRAAEQTGWQARRKLDTLCRLAAREVPAPRKRIVFRFLSSPVAILGGRQVGQIEVFNNPSQYDAKEQAEAGSAVSTEIVDTGLVLRAIGYRGRPVPGLPFDTRRGTIPHQGGRVEGTPGTYVTGWIKRGPQGIIGTNKKCARETVAAL
ncbi:MAG: NADP oxidoreductase, partial [Parahaliea sp.]